jgi:peptidoglycan/xylan/chitin deacetylase (PgdA/CDA1 family)
MNSIFVKIPRWIQRIFNKQDWSIKTEGKEIYLTFDDGPTPEITEWVLDQLALHNAKATFFCIGKNIEKHPAILRKIIAEEHGIGNHTYQHLQGWKTKTNEYLNDILKTEKLLRKHPLKNSVKLFRPPYGKIKRAQVRKLLSKKYKVVMWEVLSADYDHSISTKKCLENILKNTSSGSIVVFHDSIKAKKNLQFALPRTLEHFSKQGYIFKSIS